MTQRFLVISHDYDDCQMPFYDYVDVADGADDPHASAIGVIDAIRPDALGICAMSEEDMLGHIARMKKEGPQDVERVILQLARINECEEELAEVRGETK